MMRAQFSVFVSVIVALLLAACGVVESSSAIHVDGLTFSGLGSVLILRTVWA
jgi:hypothetical protein